MAFCSSASWVASLPVHGRGGSGTDSEKLRRKVLPEIICMPFGIATGFTMPLEVPAGTFL